MNAESVEIFLTLASEFVVVDLHRGVEVTVLPVRLV